MRNKIMKLQLLRGVADASGRTRRCDASQQVKWRNIRQPPATVTRPCRHDDLLESLNNTSDLNMIVLAKE
jgi:hypothetical protein